MSCLWCDEQIQQSNSKPKFYCSEACAREAQHDANRRRKLHQDLQAKVDFERKNRRDLDRFIFHRIPIYR